MDTPPCGGKRSGGPGQELGPARKMTRIVMKFGGTSVADLDRIRNAAKRIKDEYDRGNEIAVTVSAMAGATNLLIGYVRDLAPVHDAREYDVVVSSGEQVTSGLMAMALQALGIPARSWLGWQLPVATDAVYGRARIQSVGVDEIVRRFANREIAVVAGFQGLSPDRRVTTLGRGGSDASAVALAAALQADRCDIYTDVDGVYTSDPRIVSKACKLERVTYEEMLEMASQGAKVLQTRSVELAMKSGVHVQVRSSFNNEQGTLLVDEDEIVEQHLVSGIAYSRDESKVTLIGVSDRPGVAAGIFGPLADANVNVDMIVQSTSADGMRTDITFTVGKADFERTMQLLNDTKAEVGYESILADQNVVKISVIGVGMRSHAGVAQEMFRTLADKGINIQAISTSEIKISVLVAEEYTELALRALHTAYGLDAD
jgi:aspartate kinase